MKIVSFFKNASPLKLVGLAVILALPITFFEESFPTIFITLRLLSFALVMYVIIKLIFKD
ncbi:MAG: hypothetical protein ACJAYP_000822 [Flavobacterium sp.]|jgi:hypothetical protein